MVLMEKNTNLSLQYVRCMSATSKSRLVLFLMIALSLIFFVSSLLAANFSNEGTTSNTSPSNIAARSNNPPTRATPIYCLAAKTGENRIFGECSYYDSSA